MNLHILGICGTFMGGVAVLAKQLGHTVAGSDQAFYPPMNDQLRALGITLHEGYTPEALIPAPDLVIVGNTMKRGNPALEWMLNQKIPYISGPEWLHQAVLSQKKIVLAVAGTHGKTTTSSMLAWILEKAGKNPGFLIGGVPQNFGVSARLGDGDCFVIEADEYDTAFFDKRSKFVHYHPDITILNNLEYDHADIFPNLAAIQTQFHHLIRTIPSQGTIIRPAISQSIDEVLSMGCWSNIQTFSVNAEKADWKAQCHHEDGTVFDIHQQDTTTVHWDILGKHNVSNALAATAAADAAGVSIEKSRQALETFQNVKRRLEIRGEVNNIKVYDDFAHHPTAIEATINAVRSHARQKGKLVAVLHMASNSMRMGIYKDTLGNALKHADDIWVLKPQDPKILDWINPEINRVKIADTLDEMAVLADTLEPFDRVLIMSNGDFGGIHEKILDRLRKQTHV